MYVFKNFSCPKKSSFWIYEKSITCTVVLACYVQRGGCTQAIYSEFSAGLTLALDKIGWRWKSLSTQIIWLRVCNFGSVQLCTVRTVRGFPSALKCTSLTQLKRRAKATLRNVKTRTSLCCLWKFLQLNQVRVETLPSCYAMAKIVSLPCSIFYLQGFSTTQGNDSLCCN